MFRAQIWPRVWPRVFPVASLGTGAPTGAGGWVKAATPATRQEKPGLGLPVSSALGSGNDFLIKFHCFVSFYDLPRREKLLEISPFALVAVGVVRRLFFCVCAHRKPWISEVLLQIMTFSLYFLTKSQRRAIKDKL